MADTPSSNTHPYDIGLLKEMVGEVVAEVIKAQRDKGQRMIDEAGSFQKLVRLMEEKQRPVHQQKKMQRERIGLSLQLVLQTSKGIISHDEAIKKAREYGNKICDNAVEKLVQMSTFTGGGALLPEEFLNEVTEYLRDAVVVFNMGIPDITMSGSLTIPKIASGASAGYVAEGAAPNATAITFGDLKLESKKILAIIPLTNDWIESNAIGGSSLIADDLARAVSDKMNSTLLRSTGAGGEPTGIRYAAIAANLVNQTMAGAVVTVAEATYDLLRLQYLPEAQKVVPRNDGNYVFSPRTKLAILSARDGNNNPVWQAEMAAGTLYGQKWHSTTAIPDNLSVTTSADSEILFAYTSSAVLGREGGMRVEMFDNANYVNASGNVASGVSEDVSVLRAKTKHDLQFRQEGKEIAAIIDCDWTKIA